MSPLRCSFLNFIKAIFHLTGEGSKRLRVQVVLLGSSLVTRELLPSSPVWESGTEDVNGHWKGSSFAKYGIFLGNCILKDLVV